MSANGMKAPLLISLPHGLNTSGVTMWAVRLVNGLAAAGRACALVVHDEPPGQSALEAAIDPRVEVFDARGLAPLDACDGDLSDYLPVYRVAAGVLSARTGGGPVVCAPSLVGDSYGVFAELSREFPAVVRTIAVHHSDTRYNDLLCSHYEPLVHAFVGVSGLIAGRLRGRLPARAAEVHEIPYGVECGEGVAGRPGRAGRALRLLYTGRMDHEQKRVAALVRMSDELARRGLAHELALLGDGPASVEIDAMCAERPCVRRFPAAAPAGVAAALERADLFVLASRYEGLSVSLLEALARGCVPVVTPSESGTAQLVRDGETGYVAPAGPGADEVAAGAAMAEAVLRGAAASERDLGAVRRRGWSLVRESYSVERCAARYGELIDRVAAAGARPWPAERPGAFTGRGGGSGTVPAEAPARLESALRSLAGRRVALYGAGRHTIELAAVVARAPVELAAIIDDDPRDGSLLGVPVLPPARAGESGASDVVISSWLHEEAMWSRRAVFERQGLRLHRLYGRAGVDQGTAASAG